MGHMACKRVHFTLYLFIQWNVVEWEKSYIVEVKSYM
jgi:hypothetical protein